MELKELEAKVAEFEKNTPLGKFKMEDHPTWNLDEHPDGWEDTCYCWTCGSYD